MQKVADGMRAKLATAQLMVSKIEQQLIDMADEAPPPLCMATAQQELRPFIQAEIAELRLTLDANYEPRHPALDWSADEATQEEEPRMHVAKKNKKAPPKVQSLAKSKAVAAPRAGAKRARPPPMAGDLGPLAAPVVKQEQGAGGAQNVLRWPTDKAELEQIRELLAKVGYKNAELTKLSNQTYNKIRGGRFNKEALMDIITTRADKNAPASNSTRHLIPRLLDVIAKFCTDLEEHHLQ